MGEKGIFTHIRVVVVVHIPRNELSPDDFKVGSTLK
jgi:hypothetical protein